MSLTHPKIKLTLLVLGALLLGGCGKPTPLQQLHRNTQDDTLTPAFWAGEEGHKTQLWHEAVTYCTAHAEKPNCGAVLEVNILSHGSTTVPAYGTSGYPLVAPHF